MSKKLKSDLSNYDAREFEKPSMTVDVAICTIVDGDLKVMLIKREDPPYENKWAIPGGFLEVEKKESLEETAARELFEETGAENIYVEQLKTYGDPGRDPREFAKHGTRVVTVAYFALVPYEIYKKQKIKAGSDAKDVKLFSLRKLPRGIAFDHKKILSDLLDRLVGKISYLPIAFELVPKRFTWSDLQNVYEVVLGKKLLTPNFRRKIKSMYHIKVSGDMQKAAGRGRPSVYLKYCGIKDMYQ